MQYYYGVRKMARMICGSIFVLALIASAQNAELSASWNMSEVTQRACACSIILVQQKKERLVCSSIFLLALIASAQNAELAISWNLSEVTQRTWACSIIMV
jgi:hypothetical protein